jgi:hypothetical protein
MTSTGLSLLAKKGPQPTEKVEELISNAVPPNSQESSNASIADKNAKAIPAQKSAKTVFFEESAKGSSQNWVDFDDKDMNGSPQKNYEGS